MASIKSIKRWGCPLLHVCTIGLTFCAAGVSAQVVGDEAEMDRLQARADELIANSDPEGAAMSMGRAALMAAQLAKRQGEAPAGRLYRGAETLYRAEEYGYRALALFQRAGGQAPASTGVCHTAESARAGIQQAQATLTFDDQTTQQLSPKERTRLTTLRATADDWTTVVASMQSDFQCP
ncbi:MAG: hypothetical protein U0172_02175 [Nitrospiraceae bacterium]